MKQSVSGLIGAFAMASIIVLPASLLAAGPAAIDLRSAAHFTILATSRATTTGGGIINGDVGLSPFGSQGIPPGQINGTIYNGGPIAAQAELDSEFRDYRRTAQLPGFLGELIPGRNSAGKPWWPGSINPRRARLA